MFSATRLSQRLASGSLPPASLEVRAFCPFKLTRLSPFSDFDGLSALHKPGKVLDQRSERWRGCYVLRYPVMCDTLNQGDLAEITAVTYQLGSLLWVATCVYRASMSTIALQSFICRLWHRSLVSLDHDVLLRDRSSHRSANGLIDGSL